jgi:hypothetical protein
METFGSKRTLALKKPRGALIALTNADLRPLGSPYNTVSACNRKVLVEQN